MFAVRAKTDQFGLTAIVNKVEDQIVHLEKYEMQFDAEDSQSQQ